MGGDSPPGRASARILVRGLRLIGHSVRQQPAVFLIAVLGAAAYGGLGVGTAFVVGEVVGRVVVPAIDRGEAVPAALAAGFAAIMAVGALRVAALYARRVGAATVQFRLTAEYRRRVTRRYLSLPPAWHRRNPTGTLLSNASADVEAQFAVLAAVPLALGTIFMLLVSIGGLFLVDYSFGLVALALFPALFVINFFYSRRMSPRIARAQALRAVVSATAHESFDGALVVKTMGREAEETRRFEARANELRDAMVRVGRLRSIVDPLVEALPSVGSLVVLAVGVGRLRQGAVTVEEIFSVSFLFAMLAVPVRSIGWALTELPRSVVGWDRVRGVLTASGDMTYGQRTLAVRPGEPVSLALRDVRFAYGDERGGERAGGDQPGGDERAGDQPSGDRPGDDLVLDGVTFEVAAGTTVALVGPTGAGKSTIASLAARLIDPDGGTVAIGGVDARALSAAELARTVALVPQLPFVFDDTVRGNVALERPGIDDDAVRRALGLAQAAGFVDRLPAGLDTELGERGTSLSGGQRQRLTLARALAGSPRVLVLDDATSAVDPRVEAAILSALRRQGGTILVVAYRRATIALADEVIYLERGRVVAHGPHEELLETVPAYASLVTAYERADAEREHELAEDDVRPPAARADPAEDEEMVHEVVDDPGRAGVVS